MNIIYSNWIENIYDYRFLKALNKNYNICVTFFGNRINKNFLPKGVKIINPNDAPLLPIPLKIKLAQTEGNISDGISLILRALIFRRIIRKMKPDLLIGNYLTGVNPYGFCCAFSDYHPFLVIVWGSDILIESKESKIFYEIAKYTLKKADGVIVDSDVQKKEIIRMGYDSKKIWKFPWGIDLDMFNPKINSSRVKKELHWENNRIIISTRKLNPIYGVENLIMAIPTIIKKNPDARFLIIGDGVLINKLKGIVSSLHIEKYMCFKGKLPYEEIPIYLNAADIYVSTSYSDGTSASLLEAIACGLPVVVTNIPANNEWIINGENGYLVPIKNPSALAKYINLLLEDDGIRSSMSIKNLEISRARADWKKNANIFYDAIETLTKNTNKRREIYTI